MTPRKSPKPSRPVRATKTAPAAPKVSLPRVGRAKPTVYKANVAVRLGAATVDLLVGTLPALALLFQTGIYFASLLVIAYLLVRDGLPIAALEGRSVGKKLLGLHVEIERTGATSIDLLTSVKRNLPLVPGLLLMPFVWSGVSPFLGFLLAAIPPLAELVVIATDPNGLRLGDRLAGTKVLD